jgi:hypothetical protein
MVYGREKQGVFYEKSFFSTKFRFFSFDVF